MNFFVKHKITSFACVAASIIVLVGLMRITPSGLVPNEDTGTFFAIVDLPPATSLERTQAALAQVDSLIASNPAVDGRTEVAGYSFIAGQGSSYGTFICRLKPWDERGKGQDINSVIGQLYMQTQGLVKDARVLLFAPPMIPGYSITNGFEFNLQDKTGGSLDAFYNVAQNFLEKLNERPEIAAARHLFQS